MRVQRGIGRGGKPSIRHAAARAPVVAGGKAPKAPVHGDHQDHVGKYKKRLCCKRDQGMRYARQERVFDLCVSTGQRALQPSDGLSQNARSNAKGAFADPRHADDAALPLTWKRSSGPIRPAHQDSLQLSENASDAVLKGCPSYLQGHTRPDAFRPFKVNPASRAGIMTTLTP